MRGRSGEQVVGVWVVDILEAGSATQELVWYGEGWWLHWWATPEGNRGGSATGAGAQAWKNHVRKERRAARAAYG